MDSLFTIELESLALGRFVRFFSPIRRQSTCAREEVRCAACPAGCRNMPVAVQGSASRTELEILFLTDVFRQKATVRSYIRLEASIIWSSFDQGRVQFPFRICYFAFLLCASPDGSRDSTNPPLCVPLNNSIVCNLPASCRFSTKPRMVA